MDETWLRRYLLLGLRLGRHVDGYVDAYYGPAELRRQADEEALADPAALAAEADSLRAELDGSQRGRYLAAQLAGVETAARRLAGEAIPFADEVEGYYGVRPELAPEEEFEAAHRRLDEALPGDGDLSARVRAWLDGQTVPREALPAALEALRREFRARTNARWPLPEGEGAELELVENEPWGAFNYYLGALRSRVAVNLDVPVPAYRVPELVAHEIYPGHHTEHALKEVGLYRGEGRLEESLFLVPTPQALLNEGIATTALEQLGDDVEAAAAEIMAAHGAPYDAEQARAVREADSDFDRVTTNMGVLLHERGADPDEVAAYGVRWTLRPRERVAKNVQFLQHPTWRAYSICYSAGHELARRFHGGDPQAFGRLLREQLTTADLL